MTSRPLSGQGSSDERRARASLRLVTGTVTVLPRRCPVEPSTGGEVDAAGIRRCHATRMPVALAWVDPPRRTTTGDAA